MDLFEDFEFKPLTKGLGFHKKPANLKQEVEESGLIDKAFPNEIPSRPNASFLNEDEASEPLTYEELLKSLSTSEPKRATAAMRTELTKEASKPSTDMRLTQTLPRKIEASPAMDPVMPRTEVPSVPFDDIQKRIDTPRPSISSPMPGPGTSTKPSAGTRRSSSNSPAPKLMLAPICIRSIFLDALTVFAVCLLFAISLLYVTQVSVPYFLHNLQNDMPTQLTFGVLFLAVYQMYVIVTRSFFGSTLGEWTFEFQVGDEREQKSGMYPLRVVWRSLVIMITGVFVLPFLSFVFRKDLAGYFSGLQLYRKRS